MRWSRRAFLGAGITTLSAGRLLATAGRRDYLLRPEPVVAQVGGVEQNLLGFNGVWPGHELRARQEDDLHIRVDNGLQDGVLVHWHGLRLPNRMDGVNVLTQDVIPPSGAFDYRFKVQDAGTFWYHSHYISFDQVSRGLFGPLIVEELRPPDVDLDIPVMLFDMLVDHEGVFEEDHDPSRFSTAGRIGNFAMAIAGSGSVRRGDRLRLRIINPSIDRVFDLSVKGIDGYIVALDGMPIAQPRKFANIQLAPGQRCDIIGDVTGEIAYLEGGELELGRIDVSGVRQRRHFPPPALAPNAMPRPRGRVIQTKLLLQGGVGGTTHGGFGSWALNDISGLPRVPLVDVRRGSTVQITMQNVTAFDHVIHLHGHHFWELSDTGKLGDYRDGTMVPAGRTRDILCVLDNPGDWLLHCHMLSHEADGMATWLKVR